jgi:hypothetical protein
MTISEALNKAADYIEVHGLFKGDFYDKASVAPAPPCCGWGALRAAIFGDPRTKARDIDTASPEVSSLYADCKNKTDEVVAGFFPRFNDRETTTQADVVTVLRKAATL